MMSKILAFLLLLSWLLTPFAALADGLPAHWNNGQGASQNGAYLLPEYDDELPNERKLTSDTNNFLKFTDLGPNSAFKLQFDSAALPILRGGTGGATQQAAIDNLLDYVGKSAGDIIYYNGTHWTRLAKGSNGYFLGVSGGILGYYAPSGSGTVTSIDMTVPSSILAVSGGPVTGSGTFAVTLQNQTANYGFFGPTSGGAAAPTFRAMVEADVPSLSASKIGSGNLAKARSATEGVYNDQSNTYSGTATQDMGASGQTLVVPKKSTLATAGEVAVDTDDLKFRSTGGNTRTVVKTTRSVGTGTGLTGGGDLSADRTIALDTPVAATNGGTGQTTWSTGQIPYASGSNTLSKLNIGSTGQVLTVSGGIPAWSTPGGSFGGSGGDGAITKGAVTETTIMQYAATTFVQTVSTAYTFLSGSIFRSTSTQDWNGTATGSVGSVSPAPIASTDGARGSGPAAGFGSITGFTTAGAGGGGNGGAGGNGGGTGGGKGGGTYQGWSSPGSSGGTAGSYSVIGGQGGGGGAFAVVESIGNFTIGSGGSINLNGANGSAGTGGSGNTGGGGGGSGGTFQGLCAATLTKTGNINCNGGNGGDGATGSGGKAGAGGGGRIALMAPTITGAGSSNVNAGSNASTGDGTGMTSASAGVAVSITGTPTTRFAADMRKNWLPLDTFYHLQADAGTIQPGQELKCEAKGVIQMYAAFNARTQREQAELAHEYTFGTTLDGICQAEWIETTCGDEGLANAA